MPKEITIELLEPLQGAGGVRTTLKLREPRAYEAFQIGELQIASQAADGSVIYMDRDEVFGQYMQALLVKENAGDADGFELLRQMSLADAYQVKDAIRGFFSEAQKRAYAPKRASSSGNSTDSPSPSS